MNKKFTLIIILELLLSSTAFITSDYGFTKKWDSSSGWVCPLNSQITQQVLFKDAFQNIPQVVIIPLLLADPRTGTQYGYQVSISEITTTYFNIFIEAKYAVVNNCWLNWFAIDDQRFEIIHKFNQDNPTTTQVPHSNKNLREGFILLTSFVGANQLAFTLKLGTITESNVEVKFTNTNLLNAGYTIVLCQSDAFESSDLITQIPQLSSSPSNLWYCSPTTILQPNKIWIYYPLYFSFNTATPTVIRISFQQTATRDTMQYCLVCWGAVSFIFDTFGHQTTTINLEISSYFPMLMRKIRVSKSLTFEDVNTFQLQLPELNKSYNTNVEEILEIPDSMQFVTFRIKVKCQPNQKVKGMFKRYLAGSNQFSISEKSCFSGQNFISFYPQFYQAVKQYQYVVVQITADQLLLTQKIFNQQIEMILLAQVNLI